MELMKDIRDFCFGIGLVICVVVYALNIYNYLGGF